MKQQKYILNTHTESWQIVYTMLDMSERIQPPGDKESQAHHGHALEPISVGMVGLENLDVAIQQSLESGSESTSLTQISESIGSMDDVFNRHLDS